VLEECSDASPGRFNGSLGGFSEQCLELGEDLLDRIEVRAIGRQEKELGTCSTDHVPYDLGFVAAEIVDDDDVAGSERRQKKLLDIGAEAVAVDGSVDDARCVDPVAAQGRQEGQRSPMPVRDLGQKPVAAWRPAAQAGHVGLGPGLVDEDQPSRIKPALIGFPACAPSGDVGTILLGGEQCFF